LWRIGFKSVGFFIDADRWRGLALEWGWSNVNLLEAGCPWWVVAVVVVLEDRLLLADILLCHQ
jgi:hypothetical protein